MHDFVEFRYETTSDLILSTPIAIYGVVWIFLMNIAGKRKKKRNTSLINIMCVQWNIYIYIYMWVYGWDEWMIINTRDPSREYLLLFDFCG